MYPTNARLGKGQEITQAVPELGCVHLPNTAWCALLRVPLKGVQIWTSTSLRCDNSSQHAINAILGCHLFVAYELRWSVVNN